jgi:O-antigen/teichoic acid export membrane protein
MKDEKTYFIPKDSLYRNSIYLMINTIVITGFGFIFWMINTRLYSAENVGLATALISVMNLIAGLSVLGLNVGLIRYLPKAKDKNKKINTGFTLVIISTIIITSIFLMFSKYIAPKLMFVHDNMILSFVFILFMIVASIDSLMQGIFTAYRKTKYILFKNTVFSVLKIIFPFFLVFLGAYGIFSSYMISSFMALIVSFVILVARFSYKPRFVFYSNIIKKIGGYSFGNYIAGFIGGLPAMLLPLLILNKLGAEQTAYYYVSMMIAALLFASPSSTSSSLFAEGSYNQSKLKHQIKKSIKIIFPLLIPAIIFIIIFGKYLLLFFGKSYSSEGFKFLQLIALSSMFVGINYIFATLLRVKKKIKSLIIISIISALLILGLSWMLIDKGLLGIGYAYLIGQAIIVGVYLIFFRR